MSVPASANAGTKGVSVTTDRHQPTTRRTANAVAHLLDVEERAATRGHAWLRRLALVKATQAATTLRNEALDRCGAFNTRGGLMKNTGERLW